MGCAGIAQALQRCSRDDRCWPRAGAGVRLSGDGCGLVHRHLHTAVHATKQRLMLPPLGARIGRTLAYAIWTWATRRVEVAHDRRCHGTSDARNSGGRRPSDPRHDATRRSSLGPHRRHHELGAGVRHRCGGAPPAGRRRAARLRLDPGRLRAARCRRYAFARQRYRPWLVSGCDPDRVHRRDRCLGLAARTAVHRRDHAGGAAADAGNSASCGSGSAMPSGPRHWPRKPGAT